MADLGTLLVGTGAIDQSQLDSARSHQRSFGGRIEEILVEQRMVSEPKLADAISKVTGTRRIVLEDIEPDGSARAKIPVNVAEESVSFPVALRDEGRTLWVAVTDPTDLTLMDRLATRAGCRVRPIVAGGREIRRAIALHYRGEVQDTIDMPEPPSESSDAFKITDMSGKTVMTSLEDLREKHVATVGAGAPPPPIADDDDDSAFSLFDIQALSPEEMARLERVREHQEKSTLVLRAIAELLVEKGVVGRDELRGRLS